MNIRVGMLGALVAGLMLSGCSASSTAGTAASSPAARPSPTTTSGGLKAAATAKDQQAAHDDAQPTPGASPQPAGTWRLGRLGTYLVGRGIPPGIYDSAAPVGSICRWVRLSGLTGVKGEVIAGHDSAGPSRVTIRASDKFFQTNGCSNWHKVG